MSIETMDLTGQTFGRLTPFERGLDRVTKSGRTYKTWNCKCECGNVKNVTAYDLVRQKTKSCGCLRRDTCAINGRSCKIHGYTSKGAKPSDRRLYHIWSSIKQRCTNSNEGHAYKYYGARGIKYCSEWEAFEPFKTWALNNGYSDDLSIDRIDCNGDYEPSNCRWVTWDVQSNNKRNTVKIRVGEEEHTAAEWAKITGTKHYNIEYRSRFGFHSEEEIISPVYLRDRNKTIITYEGESHDIKEWAALKNLSYSTINWRLKNGWSVEDALNTPRENHSHRVIDVDGIKHTIQEWSQINGIGITTIYERLSNGWNEKDAVTTVPHSGVKHDYALPFL